MIPTKNNVSRLLLSVVSVMAIIGCTSVHAFTTNGVINSLPSPITATTTTTITTNMKHQVTQPRTTSLSLLASNTRDPPPQSNKNKLPIRNRGAIFGLFESSSKPITTTTTTAQFGASDEGGREWKVEKRIVNATDTNGSVNKVTILSSNKNFTQGGDVGELHDGIFDTIIQEEEGGGGKQQQQKLTVTDLSADVSAAAVCDDANEITSTSTSSSSSTLQEQQQQQQNEDATTTTSDSQQQLSSITDNNNALPTTTTDADILTNSGSISVPSSETLEDIASMLMESPPTLRQLRDAAEFTDGVVEDEAAVTPAAEELKGLGIVVPKNKKKKEEEERMKQQEQGQQQDEAEDEAETTGEGNPAISSLLDKRAQIKANKAAASLDQTTMLADTALEAKEDAKIKEPELENKVVGEEAKSSPALAPTHSIEDDYQELNAKKKEEEEEEQGVVVVIEPEKMVAPSSKDEENQTTTTSSAWEELKEQAYEAADSFKAKLSLSSNTTVQLPTSAATATTVVDPDTMSDTATATVTVPKKEEKFTPKPPAETPGEKAMMEYDSIDVSATAVVAEDFNDNSSSEDDDAVVRAQREAEEATAMLKQAEEEAERLERELAEIEAAMKRENEMKNGEESSGQGEPSPSKEELESNPLGDIFTAVTSAFIPIPPPNPPTQDNINNNADTTNENLSEINGQLQKTLEAQRKELGRLRKRINELERELRRAKRNQDKVTNTEEMELQTTVALQEEYEGQLAEANNTIGTLKAKGEGLTKEVKDGKAKLEEAIDAKERVSAEYSYVVKSYEDLKHSIDANTTTLSSKLAQSQEEISSLGGKLEETIVKMKKYQSESQSWREECTSKANQLDKASSRERDMQHTIDELQNGINSTESNLEEIAATAEKEEKERNKDNLKRLSQEYDVLLKKKSKKIGDLRVAIRSANNRKRIVQRNADREKNQAVQAVTYKLNTEIEGLKSQLKAREEEIRDMEDTVKEAEDIKEEREKLMAEIMFLTKSFDDLQAELATNAETYEDCIASYEKEAAEKDQRIEQLGEELKVANDKIVQLESRIEALTAELEREKSLNANLTATVSELQNELDSASKNSGGYDDIIAILRKEAEEYKAQLSEARGDAKSLKQKKTDLEGLISKTKDSLVSERKRVLEDLEDKDTRIAQLDRELADRLNEIHASKSTVKKANSNLAKMTNRFNSEKDRADALEQKIQKLNQLSVSANQVESLEEVDRLTKLLEDVTKSNAEYKSLMETYNDKVKFISQQLLLSGQNVFNKQNQIASLKNELSEAVTKVEATSQDKSSTSKDVDSLKAKLDEVQSKSTVWKAQANGMIVQLTKDLENKNASVEELQKKLAEEQKQQQSNANNEALEEEIAQLKAAMEEIQLKAKDKMKQKNQSLKELEDNAATLTAEMEDLKREKDQITNRLNEEIQRNTDGYQVHERQLSQTEDKLAKEHLVAMAEMENEMNDTIHQLEMEIQSLKNKAAQPSGSPSLSGGGTATVKGTQNDYKVLDMERALQRSKEKEVSLINENMKMQHRIEGLQSQYQEQQQRQSHVATSVMDDDDDDDDDEAVELPTYYKEKQRPIVVRFAGNIWRKIRRKNL